jgi:hypothetical protein
VQKESFPKKKWDDGDSALPPKDRRPEWLPLVKYLKSLIESDGAEFAVALSDRAQPMCQPGMRPPLSQPANG